MGDFDVLTSDQANMLRQFQVNFCNVYCSGYFPTNKVSYYYVIQFILRNIELE